MKKQVLFVFMLWSMTIGAVTTPVTPGVGTLASAIANAASGDVLVLSTGEYGVTSNIDIATKNKALTISAAAQSEPIIAISNGSIRLREAGVQLTLDGITLEGTSSIEAIKPYPASGVKASGQKLVVKNCALRTFKRGIVVNAGVDSMVLVVENCIFRDMLRAIYMNDARLTIRELSITNSTFMHVGDADNRCIQANTLDGEEGQWPVRCLVDHCTFFGCNNTRTVYFPSFNGSQITNCICANTEVVDGGNAYAVYGKDSYVHNCLAYKAGIKTGSSATQDRCLFFNPYFMDEANDDLQLCRNSPAVGAGTDGSNLGDPRWGVSDKDYDATNIPIAERIVKEPYSMAPTTSSVRILWQLSDSLSLGTVVYGTDANNLTDTVRSRGGWMVEGEGYVHVVELRGLQPFTRYYYRIGDSKQIYQAVISSTKTAPESGVAYRIFTISDIHDNSCKNWLNMQDSICLLGADLMMCNGDFVSNGAGRDWNSALFTPGRPFLRQVPLMSATGNHETGDPLTYRWSTFFDYFSQFSHGEADDSIRDPRGEGYFGYDYGNARILAVSVSGEPSSPEFDKSSNQYKWLDNELKTATQDWILIFGHVGLTTSGYHGQWPPEYRDDWRGLLEQYAASGKKIIYFCGDDHSFEHAYKDGVHYVRPGCGRNANYAQCNTKDIKYSMYYNQISCYSTLDMAADGASLHLTARDSASNIFYEYTFRKSNEVITPKLNFTMPSKIVEVDDSIQIKWFVFDPNNDATVSLYVSPEPNRTSVSGMTQLLSNVTTKTAKYFWHTRDIMPKGDYYLYGVLRSGGKDYLTQKAEPIRLVDDTIAPPAPSWFGGRTHGANYQLVWKNPVYEVAHEQLLQDFNTDLNHMEEDSEDGCSSVMTNPSGVLKVVYNTAGDWSQTSVDYVFDTPTDCHETPTLQFRFKGDGSSTNIRLICKNVVDDHKDWWYTESLSLSSTSWKFQSIDMSTFSAFDWYTNVDSRNRCDAVIRICFAVSTESAVSGNYCIEDLKLYGRSYPALDYAKTIIRRSDTAFPQTILSGDAVYEGTDESYIDTGALVGRVYYYSAFAVDDRGNVSEPACWLSTDLRDGLDDVHLRRSVEKVVEHGCLIVRHDGLEYTATGSLKGTK